MRVLCVEDEAQLREDMVEYLRMQDYEVDEAENGEDAIDQMNAHHYDLVLCDIKMPRMDGYELLKQVRGENHLATTPFIFLSALNDRDDKMRAHLGGCDGYLNKPIDFSLLDTTLKSYIERQRSRDFLHTARLEASRQEVISALGDALDGPLTQACVLIQHLRTTLPTLTPMELDTHLTRVQECVSGHFNALHGLHSALLLQIKHTGLLIEPLDVPKMIEESVAEAWRQSLRTGVTYQAAPSALSQPPLGDRRLLMRAIAGLLAVLPGARTTAEAVTVAGYAECWTLTVADHPAMAAEAEFTPIDDTTNLGTLAESTRMRLVPILFAMQVAHAHHGRLELCLWGSEGLAVRFVLPHLNAQALAA